jgi:hypothetical protein
MLSCRFVFQPTGWDNGQLGIHIRRLTVTKSIRKLRGAHISVDVGEEVHGDFMFLLVRATNTTEVDLVRLYFDGGIFAVLQLNGQKNQTLPLGPLNRRRR